jgi:hypothetical protein
MRLHRHITDLAGSGLVLIGFLLAAMAVSAVPVLVQGLTRHPPQQVQPVGGPGQHHATLSGSERAT